MIRVFIVCFLLIAMATASSALRAESSQQHGETITLELELLALLQAEMREITIGVQKIPGFGATEEQGHPH